MPITLPVSYTSIPQIYNVLPELGSLTNLTSTQILQFAGQAQAVIDTRIAKQYSLPLSIEVPILQTIATELAIYYTLTRRMFTSKQLEDSPWPARFKERMSELTDIAKGEIPLVDSSGTIVAARTDVAEVWSTTQNYKPTFWEGPRTEQIPDRDKIDDEADRRDLNLPDRLK